MLLAAGWGLIGCAPNPQQKMVSVQWRALLVYHPLWEAQALRHAIQPIRSVPAGAFPTMFSSPGITLQPMQTPESERRRQRVIQTSAQQQQILTTRLQQVETRLLQEELAQLETEQKADMEVAQQEVIHWAEQEMEEVVRQHRLPQADAEIKRRVLQQLARVRPDQRDALNARLQEVEAEQQHLSETLQRRLAAIEEETARRLRERMTAIQQEYEHKREELRERSARRLRAEQLRASVQIRAFADTGKPIVFPPTTLRVPDRVVRAAQPPPAPTVPQQDMRPLIERDVQQWVQAICRRHRWVPIWQARAGVPDVTPQIAREMRGNTQ
jgi:hypothetical protein